MTLSHPALFDTSPYVRTEGERHLIRDMPEDDQPLQRMAFVGERAISTPEVLACVLQTKDALDLSNEILSSAGGITELSRITTAELTSVKGIGPSQAKRIRAAMELGRRTVQKVPTPAVKISSPADAANLLIPEMQSYEQEHLVVILLNTRNFVISIPLIYIGSINTSVVRIGEIFKHAIRQNAVAIIVAHNHPSGDPSPSPEDVRVTRDISKAGKLLDIELLDHMIIGRQRFVSLKERGLGFDN